MRTSPPSLLTRNRSFPLPGTRSMSPKEQKMTSGRAAIASALSMISSGVTHTGQPGPWISSISRREELVDAVADDRVGLAAAYLHEGPRPRRDGANLVEQAPGKLGVAKLVQVFHGGPSRR